MNTGRKRSALSYIPGYTNNAVLQLIIFSAVIYAMLAVTWGVILLVYQNADNFNQYFVPNVSLPLLTHFKSHWWTVLTYGWVHSPHGFWELLSDMLWLYCFGSVVQMLIGHRQIIPLYTYSLIAGGLVYLLAQMMPGRLAECPEYFVGPRAGLVGLAAAAVTLTPKYRFYLTETFSVPLILVAGIFAALTVLASVHSIPVLLLVAGGGLAGFAYVKLLQRGYRPGTWMYGVKEKMESLVTPGEKANQSKWRRMGDNDLSSKTVSQKRIDDILDKINQKGYKSLSSEEKEILMRAGKE